MREAPIFITDGDAARLRGLLAARSSRRGGLDQPHLSDLAAELERAHVMDALATSTGIVALHSRLTVTDLLSGEQRELTLVLPHEADPATGRVSVLAPLGCALMGCSEGDVIDWEMPGGRRTLRVEEVGTQRPDRP